MPNSQSAPTLEDALKQVDKESLDLPKPTSAFPENFQFDPAPQQVSQLNIPELQEASFSALLDYSFPQDIVEGVTQIGEVIYIGDGVCKVTGLPDTRVEDVITVQTESGPIKSLVLGLEDTHIESVVMGDYSKIKQGDQVIASNARLQVPAGKAVFGRVLNPLGEPVDGKGAIKPEAHRLIEYPAPSVMDRAPIVDPIKTGVMVVDTTIPIGRGQRELVIGDRKTGKSHTSIDIICNQKGGDVICVYVGIGIQAAKAKATQNLLQERGAMDYTTMVIATSDEPPSLQYIAPYAGVAIAEHFMYQGKHALIVYDDLSKQAKAYRQVSLLLKRSPGRDAYPGDIFFLHSRLLERAAKVHPKLGGGSITALPIAETQSGDVSDYIITNLMSITDGHIYLDSNMMHEGILPAVNSGTSVSRIGSKVQTSLLKKMGELAARAMARYEEVKSFETINTEVAEDTLRDIRRGKRVHEIFAQSSEIAYSFDEQVILIYLVTSGKLDTLELFEFGDFKDNFIPFYREKRPQEFTKRCDAAKKIEEVSDQFDAYYDAYTRTKDSNAGSFVVKEDQSQSAPSANTQPPAPPTNNPQTSKQQPQPTPAKNTQPDTKKQTHQKSTQKPQAKK